MTSVLTILHGGAVALLSFCGICAWPVPQVHPRCWVHCGTSLDQVCGDCHRKYCRASNKEACLAPIP